MGLVKTDNGRPHGKTPAGVITGAGYLEFFLMPFVCFLCFGLPGTVGGVVSSLSGFAPLCYFILFGFFTLGREDEQERLKIKIFESSIYFLSLFVVCLLANLVYYGAAGVDLSGLLRRRLLFNFVVLCAWPFPMGESIWFVQSLLYSYVVLYVLGRCGLARHYKPLMVACFVAMLLSTELSGVVGFRLLGYPYLPPGVLTCALPYLLLGRLMRERHEGGAGMVGGGREGEAGTGMPGERHRGWGHGARRLAGRLGLWRLAGKLGGRREAFALVAFAGGLVMAYGELRFLGSRGLLRTTSCTVGFGIAAYGLCACALSSRIGVHPSYVSFYGKAFARCIYWLSQPVAFGVILFVSHFLPESLPDVQTSGGVIVYVVCLALACVWLSPRGRRPGKAGRL